MSYRIFFACVFHFPMCQFRKSYDVGKFIYFLLSKLNFFFGRGSIKAKQQIILMSREICDWLIDDNVRFVNEGMLWDGNRFFESENWNIFEFKLFLVCIMINF